MPLKVWFALKVSATWNTFEHYIMLSDVSHKLLSVRYDGSTGEACVLHEGNILTEIRGIEESDGIV
jgi:hypothetical protein